MIEFDAGALEDLERIFDFNSEAFDEEFALHQIRLIRAGVAILNDFPRFGRKVPKRNLRELVIPTTRRTGFVALYEYDEFDRRVRIVAIRHQRERGYSR